MSVIVKCSCNARVRVSEDRLGKLLRCPRCQTEFVASADAQVVTLSKADETAGGVCPICQTEVEAGALALACPSCKQVHHRECWAEIGGCSTYGCAQAPALDKSEQAAGPVLSAWGDKKTCPMCGERIKAIALRCRYCDTEFDTVDPLTQRDLRRQVRKKSSQQALQYGVIGLFVASLIGCLAPVALIVNLAWFLPHRQEVAKGGPFYTFLGYTALVIAVLYNLLIVFFLVFNR